MTAAIEFLFILLVPLVIVGGALVSLLAVGALFDALENPGELRTRIDAAFRRPPKAPKAPGPDHYYRPHWQSAEAARGAGFTPAERAGGQGGAPQHPPAR